MGSKGEVGNFTTCSEGLEMRNQIVSGTMMFLQLPLAGVFAFVLDKDVAGLCSSTLRAGPSSWLWAFSVEPGAGWIWRVQRGNISCLSVSSAFPH